ncbi:uncharacterized protein LOC116308585 [Actinia tenebrosa]|uniref:Uncharacterized protein LOC116308585 n=1 Tax=Actinia tenebrosa TaxID=6105 RepID=A0A6P8J5E7_ACTTE|nr:uncharacterized protein LOC116308585 [Actinia tenebrosa]
MNCKNTVMLAVGSIEVQKNSQTRRQSEGLLLSLNGYGGFKARKSSRNASEDSAHDDDGILRSHSFSSVSLLKNGVTATAAVPAVPAVSAIPAISSVPELSSSFGSNADTPNGSAASQLRTNSRDVSDNLKSCKSAADMPKKSASGERKSSTTRLFRSVSLSSRKHQKDQTGKEGRDRTSSGISDSEKPDVLIERNSENLEGKENGVLKNEKIKEELREMESKLCEMTAKLHNAELENENLKSLLSSNFNGPVRTSMEGIVEEAFGLEVPGQNKTVIYPSKVEENTTETIIEASGYAVHLNHTNTCKECDKLKETTIKALVESVALRKYVRQLSEALSGGDQAKKSILETLEEKLISAQTEKEVALEELAHVIEQRNQIVSERDRALEEWGKAATKWESTLDQVDCLMKELNKVKSSREDMVFQIEKAETRMKEEMDSREKLLEDFANLNEQLNSTERERIDSTNEHDHITKYRLEREEILQKTKAQLIKAQQRCLELDAKLTAITEKSESSRKERDHAREQWGNSLKEKKKLRREMVAVVLARDEAIQKCFSTAEKLDKLKEDYNRLLNRLARTGIASSDSVSTCSSKECHFCSSQDWSGSLQDLQQLEGKEVTSQLNQDDPLESIKIARVLCHGRAYIAVMEVDKALGAAKNIQIYDEIVSINDMPVNENDQNLVRSVLDGATSSITLVLRRQTTNCQLTFDVELKFPKKSKTGLGFECGLYVKENSFGVAASSDSRSLDVGDYINKVNGKHLDKIISSSLDKVTKKTAGEKVKFNITRTIRSSSHSHEPKDKIIKHVNNRTSDTSDVVFRRLHGNSSRSGTKDSNRLSLISNDSSVSMRSRDSRLSAASSLGSMVSNADSCFADSSSDHSGSLLHSTPVYQGERQRIPTAIYVPSDAPLETATAGATSEDDRPSSELLSSDPKENETDEMKLKAFPLGPMGRKCCSTTVLRTGSPEVISDYGLTRTQSTITAIRIDEEDAWFGLERTGRFGTQETLAACGINARVMRIEKQIFQSLGLEVTGGNLVGIYVKELADDSVCREVGLEVGDRLFKLNSYDFTRATLDYATRIVRLLSSCTYVRIEAESDEYYEEVLKQTPYDSVFVRTVKPYKAMSPDELSFTVGETLHIINTRANYDQAKQLWKWVAMRKDGKNIDEGLVPCMGSLPQHVDSSASQVIPKLEAESVEDFGSDDGGAPMKRGGSERRSFLQRYRKIRKRDSRDPLGSNADMTGGSCKVVYYEILSKLT